MKRMEWLDAMRGFTMILVVAYHVAHIGMGQDEKISASLPFLVLFRMPLFFFVSGFLAYKSGLLWSVASFFQLCWKKIKVQLIPTIVFLSVFVALRGHYQFADSMEICLRSPYKGGYWFTWVLLLMFIIYYITDAIQQRLRIPHNALIFSLFTVSIVACLSIYMPVTFGKNWWKTDWMMYSSFIQVMKFMQYFLLGNIVRRYWSKVERIMDSSWFYPIIIAAAFISCADYFRWHLCTGQWINLPKTVATYSLLTVVVMFFRHYSDSFTKSTRIGTALQYIGTRTLDIYLLHYIFMPHLPMVGEWLNQYHPNFCIDIFASGSVAMLVIGFCLLTSNILRISPFLRLYLFGRK